tara:strand:- start:2481 stop:3995 length:1515 start_codon:yes stop_codon:yes gene_type:complete
MSKEISKYFIAFKKLHDGIEINNITLNDFDKYVFEPKDASYIADPFLYKYNDDYYLFCELFTLNEKKNEYIGKTVCSKLDENHNILDLKVCLNVSYHTSFPCLLEDNNEIYMLPQNTVGKFNLFKCKKFPYEWEFHKLLFPGICEDPIILIHNKVYYIISSKDNNLFINYSNTLLGEYKSYVVKTEYARNAGNIISKNGKLFRIAQICKPRYGYGMALYEILMLTPENYKEKLLKTFQPDWFPELKGTHTFNICDNLLVVDGNLRINKGPMKPIKTSHGTTIYCSSDNNEFINNYINELLLTSPITNEFLSFWKNNKDRVYAKEIVYPFIGKHLENIKSPNILDIGCRSYNKYNKYLFKNDNIKYSILDINDNIEEVIKDEYIKCSILDIDKYYTDLKEKYDVIISYGVLGFYHFTETDTKKYIENVSFLLKNNGIFLLKLDYNKNYIEHNKKNPPIKSGDKYWLMNDIDNVINLYFKKTNFKENKKLIVNDSHYFTFAFYQKN